MRPLDFITSILILSFVALLFGSLFFWTSHTEAAKLMWFSGALPALGILIHKIINSISKKILNIDFIAAVAIVSALYLGEFFSAIVIAVMYLSGQALEAYAEARATEEMSALLDNAPRDACRITKDGLTIISIVEIHSGDRLLIRSGDTVPVDGLMQSTTAILDESILTGESEFVKRYKGELLRSGVINGGPPFEIRAVSTPEQSTYAGIARLVESARRSRAPFTRLVDRYALWFIPATLGLSVFSWLISDDPLRGLAVLVVATPCPLIIAVPVALISGMSNCAKRGILVKTGSAFEALSRASVLFFDKTGTLTGGQARLIRIHATSGVEPSEVLRIAASLDQVSVHIIATTIVAAAHERDLLLPLPSDIVEESGAGLSGRVDDVSVLVGSPDYVCRTLPAPEWDAAFLSAIGDEGGTAVYVARDGFVIGALHIADQIRLETPRALRMLKRAGIRHITMLTGDRYDVASVIGIAAGVDEIRAELDPAGKVAILAGVPSDAISVMVGDGVNDAPALAAASVGVAMGVRGAAASSEAADVVLLVDRLDRLAEAIHIAKASRKIAVQSAVLGMGLCFITMIFAAAGFLGPVYGAVLQEFIDVIAIGNALRSLRVTPLRVSRRSLPAALARRLHEEHQLLLPLIDRISYMADHLLLMSTEEAIQSLKKLNLTIAETLVPHERKDDHEIYPLIAGLLGGDDPMASLSRTHREIFSLTARLKKSVVALELPTQDPKALNATQHLLYALDAIVRLHFAQEEEIYYTLN